MRQRSLLLIVSIFFFDTNLFPIPIKRVKNMYMYSRESNWAIAQIQVFEKNWFFIHSQNEVFSLKNYFFEEIVNKLKNLAEPKLNKKKPAQKKAGFKFFEGELVLIPLVVVDQVVSSVVSQEVRLSVSPNAEQLLLLRVSMFGGREVGLDCGSV